MWGASRGLLLGVRLVAGARRVGARRCRPVSLRLTRMPAPGAAACPVCRLPVSPVRGPGLRARPPASFVAEVALVGRHRRATHIVFERRWFSLTKCCYCDVFAGLAPLDRPEWSGK